MLANSDKKQPFIDSDILATLRAQLSRSWLKKPGEPNTASIAITPSGKYAAGIFQSRTHLLDVTSEHNALAQALSCKDPHVAHVVTLAPNQEPLNPLVIKILADHARRTGTPIHYTLCDDQGTVCETHSTDEFSYQPKPALLSFPDWTAEANKQPARDDIDAQLFALAKQGMETHFTSNTGTRYGAAVLAGDTIYYAGVYSSFDRRLNLHAEMSAALSAINDGNTAIVRVALVSSKFKTIPVPMCGCCRQFFAEIENATGQPITITFFALDGTSQTLSLSDALPWRWQS